MTPYFFHFFEVSNLKIVASNGSSSSSRKEVVYTGSASRVLVGWIESEGKQSVSHPGRQPLKSSPLVF